MLISKDQYLHFKSHIHFESFLKMAIMAVVVFILILSTYALFRPIDVEKYQQVAQLSLQASYPHTQTLAQHLQKQPYIATHDYFRLMRTYAYESGRVKEYPAMAIEDE